LLCVYKLKLKNYASNANKLAFLLRLAPMRVIEEDTSQETGYPNNAESFANTYPG